MYDQSLTDALTKAGVNPKDKESLWENIISITNQEGQAAAILLILQYPDGQIVYRTYERADPPPPHPRYLLHLLCQYHLTKILQEVSIFSNMEMNCS